MDDDYDDRGTLWGVALDEPTAATVAALPPLPPPEAKDTDESFLLRGDDPPSDGVYRPRLRGFGDAA